MEIKMTIGEGKQLLSDSNSELEHTKAAKPESREPQGPEHKVIGIDMKWDNKQNIQTAYISRGGKATGIGGLVLYVCVCICVSMCISLSVYLCVNIHRLIGVSFL